MIRGLTSIHRWLAIPLAPFFAMWFASGIVMHLVPFPRLTEAERIAGMAPIDVAGVRQRPRDAVAASGISACSGEVDAGSPTRTCANDTIDSAWVRLVQRSDGPVYVVSGGGQLVALRADNLAPAAVRTAELARALAVDHARRRELDAAGAMVAELLRHDQWTVAGDLDHHRPLWRVALNDGAGTELYVSSVTGEVVHDTTRRERWWGYAGSVAHWLYPTPLRARPRIWITTVWLVSALASIAAIAGAALGVALLVARRGLSPAGRWHAWHHVLGLLCAAFVLPWIVTGWLSVDDGLVFSRRKLYGTLHALDFPVLAAHPALRSGLIMVLCGCGLAFSLTGCVIGWRRLCLSLRAVKDRHAG